MFKKLGKLLIILVGVGGVGYVAFLVFVSPSGFTEKEELINSYFENITSSTVCDDHFNTETQDYCTSFTSIIDTRTIEVSTLTENGDNYTVVVLVDNVSLEFDISFVEIEVTGLKAFLNSTYYEIDFII